MSKIVIVVRETWQKLNLISHIRQATGLPVSVITGSLTGERPLGQWSLFENNHDEVARCLRDLLTIEDKGEGKLCFYELQDDEMFDLQAHDRLRIPREALRNILDVHDVQRRKLDEE